ncbi:MAG: murein peptide amidase A [Chloroflexi bacterium]|nr:murein peptide amidase A [Chloroflexota bacterium]
MIKSTDFADYTDYFSLFSVELCGFSVKLCVTFSNWIIPFIILIFLIGTGCNSTGDETKETATAVPPTNSPTSLPVLATTTPSSPEPVTAVPPSTLTAVPTTIPVPTAAPTPTPTTQPWYESSLLGNSALGQAIEHVQIGNGPRPFVIIAALHGGHECNTHELVRGMIGRLTTDPTLLPPDVTLHAIPLINPDGCASGTRSNANQVDLNRNWETANWLADAEGPAGIQPGSGGAFPFSEPETILVRDWFTRLINSYPEQQIQVISYHSVVPNTGLVQPGYSQQGQPHPAAITLAQTYANASGYLYSNVWVGSYTITGEFINWATDNSLVAADVELPDRNGADTIPIGWSETHIETNLSGLLAVMAAPP